MMDKPSTIFVKTLSGSSIFINPVTNETEVVMLKIMIKSLEGVPPEQQRILYQGKQLQNGRTLGMYNIMANSQLELHLTGMISTFTANNSNDPLIKYLMLSDEEREDVVVPLKELKKEFKGRASPFHTFHFNKYSSDGVLSEKQAQRLICFLDFFWDLKTEEKSGDLRMVISKGELLSLLHRKDGDSLEECNKFISRLNEEFNKFGRTEVDRKFVLRITKGPTNAAIDCHCDGNYATRTVQVALNSTEEYFGGRLCFFVNGHLHVLNDRPMGSVVLHPRKVFHAVTNLTKGTRYSLFVIDESNGRHDENVFLVTEDEVNIFLSTVKIDDQICCIY